MTINDTESYQIETLVLPPPVFKDGSPYAVQQGAGMVVVKSDEKREYASVEFLKWFTDAQRNLQFSTESGYLPVKKEANSLKALEAAELSGAGEALEKTLTVAIDVVNGYTLYTNKAFENADSSWYFRRNSPQNEVKTQDKAQMFDTKYQKTAVSIMEQAKEKFLVAFKSINYKQGTATSILSDIMKKC